MSVFPARQRTDETATMRYRGITAIWARLSRGNTLVGADGLGAEEAGRKSAIA
jgi:hypothetical protein